MNPTEPDRANANMASATMHAFEFNDQSSALIYDALQEHLGKFF